MNSYRKNTFCYYLFQDFSQSNFCNYRTELRRYNQLRWTKGNVKTIWLCIINLHFIIYINIYDVPHQIVIFVSVVNKIFIYLFNSFCTPDDALVLRNILSFIYKILSQFVKPPSDTLLRYFNMFQLAREDNKYWGCDLTNI
jgi:hypothetical protein